MDDHQLHSAIQSSLADVLGERLHHYVVTSPRSDVSSYGPAHAPLHHVAETTGTVNTVKGRPMIPLPHVQHPSLRSKVERKAVTRVVFRSHGDVFVAVAVHGGFGQRQAMELARRIESAVKDSVREVVRQQAASSLPPALSPAQA